ncbi:molecular chaperone DnaJ [Propionibacteriaceae bacterium ES.041]|uniref:molecular chaperone DnaJ n=1 Tax=Enemella evansiae TaxID=2016499 RepID=UPI000B97BA66|nr:molecular chaperone DnaJ [Enemella evansiae]OYN93410.1 molecular chaperone DnaJ [Enemella evansiae]OYN93846.1 molecular chaperone DnaJ [Enemella evansiae]PFG66570.1 molecular chaperone DnaJ [Propionibacteriaceae bacterium ES.041]
MTDYYEVLGVARDASTDQIKKAYRRMAMRYHPDVTSEDGAAEKFRQVQEAYDVLADERKRSIYDRGGDPSGRASAGFGGAGGFGDFGGAGFDFTNLVDAMFGQQASRGPRSRVRRGQDALIQLELELHEAAFGVSRAISMETAVLCPVCQGAGAAEGSKPEQCRTCHGRGDVTQIQRSFLGDIRTSQPCPTCRGYGTVIPNPCGECDGEGRIRAPREITVKIPAGVDSGNRIHLASQGEVGPGGGPAGDLYVELIVADHPLFKRNGDDLEMVAKIPMTAAALGTELDIQTLEADQPDADPQEATVRLKVPAGTQSGTRLTIDGRGIPQLRGRGRGDLGVTLLVQTPTKLTEQQRELLRNLADLREETKVEAQVHKREKGRFERFWEALR